MERIATDEQLARIQSIMDNDPSERGMAGFCCLCREPVAALINDNGAFFRWCTKHTRTALAYRRLEPTTPTGTYRVGGSPRRPTMLTIEWLG